MGDEGDVEKCGKRKGLIVVVVASEFVELGDISKGFLTWISMSITNMSCFGYHNNVNATSTARSLLYVLGPSEPP